MTFPLSACTDKLKHLLFILLLPCFCHAQTYSLENTVQWVDAKVGLNQLSVRNSVTDEQGFVWIATELGLFKYDGVVVTSVKNTEYPEINNHRITSIVKENETGTIIFFTDPDINGYSIKNGKIERLKKDDTIFYFTDANSLNTEIIPLKIKNALPINIIVKQNLIGFTKDNISFLYNNYFYYVGGNFLGCIDQSGTETRIAFKTSKDTQFALCDNEIFVIDKNEIQLIEGNKISKKKIAVDKVLVDFLKSSKSTNSFSTIFNSYRASHLNMNGKIYKMVFNQNKLSSQFLFDSKINNVRSFYYSEKDDVYLIGTIDMGLAIIKRNKLNTYFNTDYPNSNCHYAVAENHNHWYSYNGWQYNHKTNESKTNKINNNLGSCRFLLKYKSNNFYEATNKKLVSIEDLKTIAPIKFGKEINFLTSYTYLKNQLWVSTERTISYLKNDSLKVDPTFTQYTNPKRAINSIKHFNNHLLVGTTKGLYSYKPFSNKITIYKGLENVNARYIKPIDNNSFWVGCYGDGLFLVKNNKAYKVVDQNIELNTAHAIEEDKLGNLWISTNNGLLNISKKTLIYNTLHQLPVACYRFSTKDGLLTNEFNGGGTHPSLQTKDGIIGFPSMKGFVWFDPLKVPKQLFKGAILLDEVLADGKLCKQQNKRYAFGANTELATFHFSYPYFYDRDNLTVEYKCSDETSWKPIKVNTFQLARSKGGERLFQIRIRTHGFADSTAVTKTFPLYFELRYYEKVWFWTLIALLFVLLLMISYRFGLHYYKVRERKLQEKIDEKTAELYVNILQLEQSKSALESSNVQLENTNEQLEHSQVELSESLKEKEILIKEIHHRVKNNLQIVMNLLKIQARESTSTIIDEFVKKGLARILTMSLIHENLYANEQLDKIDLKKYIMELVTNLKNVISLDNNEIAVNLQVDDIQFDFENAVPLGLIINELLTNSFKHAFKTVEKGEITVRIQQTEDGKFEFTYADNGPGFDLHQSERKTLGLELVHQLTRQLNGTIQTDIGKSNSITLSFQTNV